MNLAVVTSALTGLKKASERPPRPPIVPKTTPTTTTAATSGQLITQSLISAQAATQTVTSEETFISSNSTYAEYLLGYLQQKQQGAQQIDDLVKRFQPLQETFSALGSVDPAALSFFIILALNDPEEAKLQENETTDNYALRRVQQFSARWFQLFPKPSSPNLPLFVPFAAHLNSTFLLQHLVFQTSFQSLFILAPQQQPRRPPGAFGNPLTLEHQEKYLGNSFRKRKYSDLLAWILFSRTHLIPFLDRPLALWTQLRDLANIIPQDKKQILNSYQDCAELLNPRLDPVRFLLTRGYLLLFQALTAYFQFYEMAASVIDLASMRFALLIRSFFNIFAVNPTPGPTSDIAGYTWADYPSSPPDLTDFERVFRTSKLGMSENPDHITSFLSSIEDTTSTRIQCPKLRCLTLPSLVSRTKAPQELYKDISDTFVNWKDGKENWQAFRNEFVTESKTLISKVQQQWQAAITELWVNLPDLGLALTAPASAVPPQPPQPAPSRFGSAPSSPPTPPTTPATTLPLHIGASALKKRYRQFFVALTGSMRVLFKVAQNTGPLNAVYSEMDGIIQVTFEIPKLSNSFLTEVQLATSGTTDLKTLQNGSQTLATTTDMFRDLVEKKTRMNDRLFLVLFGKGQAQIARISPFIVYFLIIELLIAHIYLYQDFINLLANIEVASTPSHQAGLTDLGDDPPLTEPQTAMEIQTQGRKIEVWVRSVIVGLRVIKQILEPYLTLGFVHTKLRVAVNPSSRVPTLAISQIYSSSIASLGRLKWWDTLKNKVEEVTLQYQLFTKEERNEFHHLLNIAQETEHIYFGPTSTSEKRLFTTP